MSKRRSRRRNRIVSTLVIILLIIVVVVVGIIMELIKRRTPSDERMDLNAYYGLEQKDEVALVLQNEVSEHKGKMIDGHVYLDYDTVADVLEGRFYWDDKNQQIDHDFLLVGSDVCVGGMGLFQRRHGEGGALKCDHGAGVARVKGRSAHSLPVHPVQPDPARPARADGADDLDGAAQVPVRVGGLRPAGQQLFHQRPGEYQA